MSYIKRSLAAGLCLLLAASMLLPISARAAESDNLPLDLRDHWSASYVITLLEKGIVSGYPNGRYYPEQLLTRNEAVALLYKLMTAQHGSMPQVRQDAVPYTDISGLWSEHMIAALWHGGVLESGSSFSPHAWVSRGDMARYTALCLALYEEAEAPQEEAEAPSTDEAEATSDGNDIPPAEAPQAPDEAENTADENSDAQPDEAEDSTSDSDAVTPIVPEPEPQPIVNPFSDIEYSVNREYILELYSKGIVSGFEGGLFHPNGTLTRAEAATMLCRASGYPLSSTSFAPLPSYHVIEVPYISQIHPVNAPVGCEPVSLLMGLKGKGYALDVTTRDFLDNMPKTTSNPAKGFVGSPYVPDPAKKTRTTIYPPILAEYAQQYGNVIDISGATPYQVQREVLSGNPVVVYVTLYWQKPYYRNYNIEGETQRLLSNNHAVLVCGYDANTRSYYIADPYNIKNRYEEYYYWISADEFDPLYNERRHALTVSS